MEAFLEKLNTAVPSDTLWTEVNVDFGVDPQHPGDAGLEAVSSNMYLPFRLISSGDIVELGYSSMFMN